MINLYNLYEMKNAMLAPARFSADLTKTWYRHPWNPLSYTQAGRTIAAAAEMIERTSRYFGKPAFDLKTTRIGGKTVNVKQETVAELPFCNLIHFKRDTKRNDPRVLLVAPMSGHYATLLRGTVEALLPHHDVYVTDWIDARQVPLSDGRFNLDDFIHYLMQFMSLLGPKTHTIAVCQPAVPLFAAVALMEAENDPNVPLTMTLMGGPIDTRISPTQVNQLAKERDLRWFKNNVIHSVPFYCAGGQRDVYPGFIQLSGFMSMNLDRHVGSYVDFYRHLVNGDGDSAAAHRKFYNEYLSVMDIDAAFYLQTVDVVFQRHLLPKGQMKWRDPISNELIDVDPSKIKRTALLTIEGELDDISAHGQTTAAHDLATGLAANKKYHHFQQNVGHYGIFNGRRWREFIMPRMRRFMREMDSSTITPVPEIDIKNSKHLKAEKWDKSIHGLEAVTKRLAEKAEKAKAKADSKQKSKKTSAKKTEKA